MATEPKSSQGVLIADSSSHMVSLIAGMLRSIGKRDFREARDAQAAMTELNTKTFAVLLIDDDGMDGVELTRQLRASADCTNRYVPVIMMSSAPAAKRIAAARDAGVTEFLRKPFAANHLQSRLTSIEANPRGFIEVRAYTGPDRRRKTIAVGEKDRRGDEPAAIPKLD